MSNSNSNRTPPKRFTNRVPLGVESPRALHFSSSNDNLSSIGGNGNSNRGNLNALSEYSGERSEEEFGGYAPRAAPPSTPVSRILNGLNNGESNNGNNNGYEANNEYSNNNNNNNNNNNTNNNNNNKNNNHNNNSGPPLVAFEGVKVPYPVLGGPIFVNLANPKKPGKRNNGKTGGKARKSKKSKKSRKTRRTRKNRK